MKKLMLLLLTATFLISCKKETTAYVGTDPNSVENASVISAGKVSFSDDRFSESLAKIYQKKDGVYVLGLEQMNYQYMFGETTVYLSSVPQLTTTAIKIFSAVKLHGNIYTPVSSAVNIPAFKYLIIQAGTESSPVAGATME